MRRASGPQPGSTFFIRKETSNKNKSPNLIKAKSRGKIVQQSTSSNVISRKNNSFSKAEQNQSSTFFTTHTTKEKKSQSENKRSKDLKKHEKEIMQVLHESASIIQRQWRKYLIRQYQKRLMPQKTKPTPADPLPSEFDSVSAKTSQVSEAYNNKKYYSTQLLENKKVNQNSFNRNVFSFNLSGNKQSKFIPSPQKDLKAKGHQSNYPKSVVDLKHNRTRSDQPLPNLRDVKIIEQQREQKNLGIAPKTINLAIEGRYEEIKQKYDDHFIKTEKSSLDEVLRKLETKLEQKKLKKILALENSFSNNLLTFRSYKKNIESVAEQHNKKLTILQNKKKHLLEKLNEFVSLCEKNIEQLKFDDESKLENTELKSIQKINPNQEHHLDISFNDEMSGFHSRSLMLDEWDFDAQFSDKKIIPRSENMSKDRKSEEILIDDTEKQVTIIDELINNQNPIEINQEESCKNNKLEVKQIIFNTPPKQSEIKSDSQDPNPKISANLQQKTEPIPNFSVQSRQVEKQKKLTDEIKDEKEKPKKKLRSQTEVQEQLNRFHAIKPNIDVVNNWLLQISHFILDNFGHEFTRKLIQVEQPSPMELFRHCIRGEPYHREYISISHKIFKQFEFFHIKTLLTQEKVDADRKQAYSALMYTFHQALYDCLNRMLLDELIEGRNWISYPWSRQFKVKKLVIGSDHSKQCLEKAINRVSNISDYNIMPDTSQIGRDFEQTQNNLIFAEEIKEIPLTCEIQRGFVMYSIAQLIQKQIINREVRIIAQLLSS